MKQGWIARLAAPGMVVLALAAGARALPLGATASSQLDDVREALDREATLRDLDLDRTPHEFYFTRAMYTSTGGYWGRGTWAIDYPKADQQFVFGLRRLTNVDAYQGDNAIPITDPRLSRYPFLYALEVGYMSMRPDEVEALRRYLMAGGFLFIDDFWGSYEWRNFELEIRRVLPGRRIVELPLDHPVFHTFYDIDAIEQVPSVRIVQGGPTYEQDGKVPHVRAIFAEDGRLLVLINWNTDLGDAWEWVDNPFYPLQYSNFAYKLAVNAILYSMSH